MAISFDQIQPTVRVPIVAAEFNSSRATQGASILAYRVLLLGQKRASGTAAANTLHRVTTPEQVLTLAGRGSMLHRMAIAFFANNRSTEVWIGVLDDDAAGVAATATLTVTGPATAAGTLSLWIGGSLLRVGVSAAASANTIASSIGTAVNAAADLPVTAAVSTNVVTLTFRHKGEVGNALDVRVNYQVGEAYPAGVAVGIVPMANGATNPSLASLIAAMGDTWYHLIALPYTDATTLTAIETELISRNGPMRMIDGVAIASAAGTMSGLGALGDSRNSEFLSIVAQPGKNPVTPPMEFAAAVTAITALHAQIDPARPFQTLQVGGVLPPADADLFTLGERNQMLYDGISTTRVAPGGVVQIERLITTYQTAPSGAADVSKLDLTTMLTLQYLRFSFRTQMQNRYPRHKLADDGTRFGPGQSVITPLIGKAEAVAWAREMEERGLVEKVEEFKANLIVERNALDRNRLDFLLPPDVINQFIVGAAQIQFRL